MTVPFGILVPHGTRLSRRIAMKRSTSFVVLSLLAALSLATAALASAPAGKASGHWEGSITVQGRDLPIVVDLDQGADGVWKGEIDIPVQGIRNLALDAVSSDATTVSFHMTGVPGDPTFQGTFAEGGGSVSGDMLQSGQTFPFRMTRTGAPTLGAKPEGPALVEKGVPGTGVEGEWHGVLSMGLRLIVKVKKNAEGAYTGTMDSVDQGAKDLPLDTVTFEGNVLSFSMTAIGGAFEGTLADDGSKIAGTWSQGGGASPLELLRSGR
jgi:hypothetical protein